MGKTEGQYYYGQNNPRPKLIIAVTEFFVYFLSVLPNACMWYWNRGEGGIHLWNVCSDNWKNG